MNDPYDLNKLIREAKSDGTIPPNAGDVPLLGQQVPVLQGLPVNGRILTIYDLIEMPDEQFKEIIMASIIHLMGAMYMPASPPQGNEASEELEDDEALDTGAST